MRRKVIFKLNRISILQLVICVLILFALLIPGKIFADGLTTRVSVSSTGMQANWHCREPSISSDGRYVAFSSDAYNLVDGDTNGSDDIFVHDRQTGQTMRVSVSSTGVQGNNICWTSSISFNGRYVAFDSDSDNLVVGDTNGVADVFVHDRQTGETTRVSVSSTGEQGNNFSTIPSISSDGRYVAFSAGADNLVDGDTNNECDIFVHDRQTGETMRVSVSSNGVQGNADSTYASISSEGRYIAYQSFANNLVVGDTNGVADVFVHDRQTGETTRVSVSSTGEQGNGGCYYLAISSDGRYVAFHSYSDNLVDGDTNTYEDIFVHDRQTGETTRVSVSSTGEQGDSNVSTPSISSDGRYVAFSSLASNLVDNDTNNNRDVFLHDRQTGQTTLVSVSSNSVQGNWASLSTSISSDGRYVAFGSAADNLVDGDTNAYEDIFVRDRQTESVGLTLPGIPLLLLGE